MEAWFCASVRFAFNSPYHTRDPFVADLHYMGFMYSYTLPNGSKYAIL